MHRSIASSPLAVLAMLGALAASSAAASADEKLCDALSNLVSRPTVATTACAVPDASVMLESGFTNQSAPPPSANTTLLYPQVTIRGGLGHELEAFLVPPSYQRTSSQPVQSGDLDGIAGLKFQFASTGKLASAVGASYALATGTPGLEASGEGLTASLDTDYALSPAVSLATTFSYQTFAAAATGPLGRTSDFAPSVVLAVSLPANISAFAEGFGRSSAGPGTSGVYGLDGGVSIDLGSRLQLDANVFDTIGTSGGGRSHAIGIGAAYLFGAAR